MRKSHSEYKDDRLRSLSVSLEASNREQTSLIFDSSSFIKSRDLILLSVYSFIPTCYFTTPIGICCYCENGGHHQCR